MVDKEKSIKFVEAHGWKLIKGHYVSHEGFCDDFEGTYWHGKEFMDFVRECEFWEHKDIENTIFEDITDVIEYIEDYSEVNFDDFTY